MASGGHDAVHFLNRDFLAKKKYPAIFYCHDDQRHFSQLSSFVDLNQYYKNDGF